MRLIAFYLPQFHEIEFNNIHHGEGFTEWTSLKNSKPLYEGHNAPRVPLNGNYYNLEDDEVKQWQIKLAKRGGFYGFCMYHYWSGGDLLLERPVEQWLKNTSLDFPFCLSWANHPWSQHLTGGNRKLIRDQVYGDKDEWAAHFGLVELFFDERPHKQANNNRENNQGNAKVHTWNKSVNHYEQVKNRLDDKQVKNIHRLFSSIPDIASVR
jgi:hypothetical protein